MIRKICLSALFVIMCTISANAEDTEAKEKVVTTRLSLVTGDNQIANHYISNQEYTGKMIGLNAEFGAFYKRSENLSWSLDLLALSAPYSEMFSGMAPANPAGTTFYSMKEGEADYSTYYNWNPVKNLHIKAGGTLGLCFAFASGKPNAINNSLSVDFQMQLKASAGIKYGWNFKKSGLFIHADFEVPFMGTMIGGSLYQDPIQSIGSGAILSPTKPMFHFSSFHNYKGFNSEIGVDLVLKKVTLFFEVERYNRWWHTYDVQNYRKYSMRKIGLCVDLVSRSRFKSNNRYF